MANEKRSGGVNKAIAKVLWQLVQVTFPTTNSKGEPMKWFRPSVTLHEKHTFLGYAYIKVGLSIAPLIALVAKLPGSGQLVKYLKQVDESVFAAFQFGLRNLEVKILRSGFFVGMREERGSDGKWRPNFYPLSAELREVLTLAVKNHADVQAALKKAEELEAAAKTKSSKASTEPESEELEGAEDFAESLGGDSDPENPFLEKNND